MRTISKWTAVLAVAAVAAMTACGGGAKKGGETAAATGEVTPQTGAAAVATGEQLFQRCATCHQATGLGIPGTYPALAGSEYANAKNAAVPIRILLHGLQGPITVKGTAYNGIMPAYGTGIEMTDAEVAAVLTYVRESWGNKGSPITPEDVAKERARGTTGAMTADSLKSLL